ncbi:MAG: bis(5'-nucleosyl)-tetraphosphatase (symmetrical) YqeK [Clostridia bacterium]|nr:bis(5'-nucleosyl)-tetraphosphatase (symmetrical) YqeK [Clostridia bacterium]
MSKYEIREEMLDALREQLRPTMSEKRYRHTVEVERMAERLGALYAPAQIMILRAAALLHDITKEFSLQTQLQTLQKFGIITYYSDEISPKTLHARTAALLIPRLYPEFADPAVIDAVRWHTTGREGMTLCEKLIYLADYIDMSRTFPDCVELREMFWGADPERMNEEERQAHLRAVLLSSFDRTVRGLLEEGALISPETMLARNELVEQTRRAMIR